MALWNRGKDSAQKHRVCEVIKYDGPNDILIWKHPNEAFNTHAQLIVGPAQEAIFVKGGQVLEVFAPGTHTLTTDNYPFLRALVGLATGGVSPFSCTVYYVNKAVSLGIDWGTDSPISVVDPIYHIPIDVRSYGDFSLQVKDGRMLLEQLVGQTNGCSHQEVHKFFSGIMAAQVRGVISAAMLERNLSPIGIDAYLSEMSASAAARLRPVFEPYGLTVRHFAIAAITAPELEAFKQKARSIQQRRMDTDITIEDKYRMVDLKAYENRELGVNEQQKWAAQIGQTLANKPTPVVGSINNGINISGTSDASIYRAPSKDAVDIAEMLLKQPAPQQHTPAPAVSQPVPDFTPNKSKESFEERARKVKFLLENGMISQEEYQEKIKQLMSEI